MKPYETNAAYHADTKNTSASMLKCYRDDGPLTYRARYVTREQAGKQTDAMKLGLLVHSVTLESPEVTDAEYIIEPDWSKLILKKDGSPYADAANTKEGKRQRAIFKNTNKDKMVIKQADRNLADAIADAVWADPLAASLLEECTRREEVFRWDYFGTGCKCRVDARGDRLALDLKTASKSIRPTEWIWTARKLGYHRQVAWYMDGMEACGEPVDRFVFIVVSSISPHEVCVIEECDSWIEKGRRENYELLAEIADCHRTGVWKTEWQKNITKIQEYSHAN